MGNMKAQPAAMLALSLCLHRPYGYLPKHAQDSLSNRPKACPRLRPLMMSSSGFWLQDDLIILRHQQYRLEMTCS